MTIRLARVAPIILMALATAFLVELPSLPEVGIQQVAAKSPRKLPFLMLGQGRTLNRPWDVVLRHKSSLCLELSVANHHAEYCHNPAPATVLEGFARIEHRPVVILGLISSATSGRVEIATPSAVRSFALNRLSQGDRAKLAIHKPLGYLAVPLPGVRCIEQLTITKGPNRILYKTSPHTCTDGH